MWTRSLRRKKGNTTHNFYIRKRLSLLLIVVSGIQYCLSFFFDPGETCKSSSHSNQLNGRIAWLRHDASWRQKEQETGSASPRGGSASCLCLRWLILGQLNYCTREGALPLRWGGEKLSHTKSHNPECLFKIITFFSGCISLTGVQHIFKLQ